MEPKYYCSSCNYQAKQKSHYDKHLLTLKHQKLSKNYPKVTLNYHLVTPKLPLENTSKFKCKYCEKVFKFASGVSRHIKYSCKKNNDEDIKELARLLNMQQKENKVMQKQIQQLTKKLQIQKVSNSHNTMTNSHNTLNNNNIYNIVLNNYDKTDYSHLTEKDYLRCIKDINHCVKTLICKVHFDPNKPENHNIYIPCIKNNLVMVYRNKNWEVEDRKKMVDDLYDDNHLALEEWYEQYSKKYPEIIKMFNKYLNNTSDNDIVLKDVKNMIIRMLYNKRQIIIETRTKGLLEHGEEISGNILQQPSNETFLQP
jgi:hypothetical protein